MTVKHTLMITPGAAVAGSGVSPVSNPAGYLFSFGGSAARMHQFGHIWFNQDPNGVTLQLDIIPPPGSANWNFVFRNDGITNDGSLALYTSDDPNLKVAFTSFGGIFAAPTLNPNPTPQGAPAYTQLTFRAANSGGKMFFYQLNCVELATGNIVSWDPIIVNKM